MARPAEASRVATTRRLIFMAGNPDGTCEGRKRESSKAVSTETQKHRESDEAKSDTSRQDAGEAMT
jgi:hypothetical protein